MKKTLATTAALLAFLGTAYAASVQGTIQAVDPTTKSITLDDGKIYQLSPEAKIGKLKVGAKVAVTVDDKTGMVTTIKKASSRLRPSPPGRRAGRRTRGSATQRD